MNIFLSKEGSKDSKIGGGRRRRKGLSTCEGAGKRASEQRGREARRRREQGEWDGDMFYRKVEETVFARSVR